jgi:hypothetical protein
MSPGLGSRRRRPGRFAAVAKIVVFDVAGPLALYLWLRSMGWSTVTSLVASGVLPPAGVIPGIARKRRIDVVGAVVLHGIAVGTTLGLATGSARPVLLEGSVPTAIFGAVCLGSLAWPHWLTGNLRVHAGVVEWTRENCHDNRACLGAVRVRTVVVVALAAGDGADYQPDE